jgi:hypothetical protein
VPIVKHPFVSAKSDGADATQVQPSNWNADHDITMATARILGRTTAGTGPVEELTVGAGLTLAAGALSGASANIQDFTTPGTTTWTKPAGAKLVYVIAYSGGSGGGGGRRRGAANIASQAAYGGGGGAAGGVAELWIDATALSATESVTVGAGGAGGVGGTSDGANGDIGAQGGASAFGSVLRAVGESNYWFTAVGHAGLNTAGVRSDGYNAPLFMGAWGTGGSNKIGGSTEINGWAYTGGGGRSGSTGLDAHGFMGGRHGGGGGGAAFFTAGSTSANSSGIGQGGLGGAALVYDMEDTGFSLAPEGAGLGGTAGTTSGGNGGNGADAPNFYVGGSGGGGGGASDTVAGNGGNGGFPGGGGGGGGPASGSFNAGNGGNGGGGRVVVITFF